MDSKMIDTTLIVRSITVEDDGKNAAISLCIQDEKGFIEVVRLRIGVGATQRLCVGMPLHFILERPEEIIIKKEEVKAVKTEDEIKAEVKKEKKMRTGKNV
jgi:hypothetical protein